MSKSLVIQSHTGPYTVEFTEDAIQRASEMQDLHIIIDRRVAELHASKLSGLLGRPSVLALDATEGEKSLERMPAYVGHLLKNGIRRDHYLLGIGGGVIQDITCFLAATLLRGVEWAFLPTTLLAQADSCIGSKSSINCANTKNIIGTFTPPRKVWVAGKFIDSLDERDLRSGIGEMLKIHAIDGPRSFDLIAADYDRLLSDRNLLGHYIERSLAIKKGFIEVDEFDTGIRNLLNFGHSFGHAIEAATDFAVPHGIAVTIGMDVALEVARGVGFTGDDTVARMRPVLRKNARGFLEVSVPVDRFLAVLAKDKKNRGSGTATVILPNREGKVERSVQAVDSRFRDICENYFGRNAQPVSRAV